MLRKITLALAISVYAIGAQACGYDFVGSCSSNVHLKINGTEGTFAIAPCPPSPWFQGLQLGNIQNLQLAGAEAITWESCDNNVVDVRLYYRVYRVGTTPGSWQVFDVPEDHHVEEGPYTTRYHQGSTSLNLSNGLMVGSNYTMEVFFRADVDTIGNDFIPETFLVQNNQGLNYKMQFTYGGNNAPPLVAVPTRRENVVCWGGHTGSVGVTVFGAQPGNTLFYQWSSNTQNFYQIDSLTAGTYTVTVTESNTGNTATKSITITQPQLPVMLNFINVTPASCTTPGAATVTASGGTGALHWVWSNGDTTATTYFPESGHYAITVTDAVGCTQKGMLTIQGEGSVNIFELPVICAGSNYVRGGQTFTTTGLYSVTVPAPNGCDSIIDFYLTVNEGAASLLANIPASLGLTCATPTQQVCMTSNPNAFFTWSFNGAPMVSAACITITSPGLYTATAGITENGKVCTATKSFLADAHLQAPQVVAEGIAEWVPPCYAGGLAIHLSANSPAPIANWQWTADGNTISAADTALLVIPTPVFPLPENILLTYTDTYGCSGQATPNGILITQPVPPPVLTGVDQYSQCTGLVEASINISGGLAPVTLSWSGGATGNNILLSPGFYYLTITDAAGCTASSGIFIEDFTLSANNQPASGANISDGSATALPDGAFEAPIIYSWNTGETTSTITGLLPGEYCVTVTDASGCSKESCTELMFVTNTTQPFAVKTSLHIRPNPVQSGGLIYFPAFAKDTKWSIYDSAAKLCHTVNIPAGNTVALLPNDLPSGLYYFTVQNADFFASDKIFLQNER